MVLSIWSNVIADRAKDNNPRYLLSNCTIVAKLQFGVKITGVKRLGRRSRYTRFQKRDDGSMRTGRNNLPKRREGRKGGRGEGGIEEASTTCRNPESIRRTTTDERRNFDRLSRAFRGQSFGQVKLFGRARGTRIMDPNRRLLSSTSFPPPPPTLIPRVFSIKLRDPSHQTHHSQTHVP